MITAIHEAGHAVAAYQLGYTLTLVTIRARGENRGCTPDIELPRDDLVGFIPHLAKSAQLASRARARRRRIRPR